MQDSWEPRLIGAENSNAVRGVFVAVDRPFFGRRRHWFLLCSPIYLPGGWMQAGAHQGSPRQGDNANKAECCTQKYGTTYNIVPCQTLVLRVCLCSNQRQQSHLWSQIKGQVLSKPKRQRNPFGFSQWFITLSLIGISYIFQFFLFQDISFPSLALDGGASLSFRQLGPALCISKLALCGQQTLILTLENLVLFVLLLSQPPVWD